MKLTPLVFLVGTMAASLLAADPTFDAWAESLAADMVRADPIDATYTQYFSGAEQDSLDRRLTPITREFRAARIAAAKEALAELAKFDHAKLDARQRTSASVIKWSLKVEVNAEPFADHRFTFNQFGGLHVSLVRFLSQAHPIRNRRDIENYLARLALVAGQMDDGVRLAKDAAARGFLMPDFIIKSALGQFERFLTDEPAKNILVTSLDERAAKLKEVAAEERAELVKAAIEKTGAKLRALMP